MSRIDVSFTSDGVRCDGWFYEPPGPGPHPCVVMAHGFGGIRAAGLAPFAEQFQRAGLAVLVFDYRYFGTSDGEPRGLIDIVHQRNDYRAAIKFARGLSAVDPQRVAVWGTSFSGGHVLTLAAEDPALAAAIIQNPFVDGPPTIMATMRSVYIRTALRLNGAYLRDEWRARAGRPPHRIDLVGPPGSLAVFTTPDAEPGYNALLSGDAVGWEPSIPARVFIRILLDRPIRAAHRTHCPLLVAVCDRDLITPAQPAVKVATLAPQGELIRYPVGHFELFGGDTFDQVVTDQIEFLERHLTRADDAGGRLSTLET